jgi:hypothetical protein
MIPAGRGGATVKTYRRVWSAVTGFVVVVGCAVPLVAWCIASPWTLAAALAAACWLWRAVGPFWSRGDGHVPRSPVVASLLDGEWRLLRLLPALALAAVGWNMLLGPTGAALLLVDAVYGVPVLVGDRLVRWPDGQAAGQVPDTVEELALPAPSEVSSPEPSSTTSAAWPGPRTLLPDLDDEELLHAWESSTRALELGPAPAALLSIVTARARYLDALVERDPEGMARRLALGQKDDWTSFDSPM